MKEKELGTFEINGVEELGKVAECLIKSLELSNIIAFYGPMGAGKTTLIKNICHRMGVRDELNSPTFALVNEYMTDYGKSIYHFDFYRIKKIEEVYDIGYEDYFYGGHPCMLEWPEMIEELLSGEYVKVEIKLGSEEGKRAIRCCFVGNNE